MQNFFPLPQNTQLQSLEKSLLGCRIQNLKIETVDPVLKTPSWIEISIYESKTASANAVLILPPTGGVNILDQGYANELCSQDVHAVILKRWQHQDAVSLDYSMHNDGALRSVAATQAAMDILNSFKIEKIGLLGTSIGAIAGALVIGMDDRIQASALIVGSARFADVVADSDESGALALRKNRMKIYDLKSLEDYRTELRKHIQYEPMQYLKQRSSLPPSLVITATQDSTVSTAYQEELVELLGTKDHIEIGGNHLEAIKKAFFYHRQQIVQFFKAQLAH